MSSCNSQAVRFVDHLLSLVNIAGNCGNGGSAGNFVFLLNTCKLNIF